jgi:hypothetical protein
MREWWPDVAYVGACHKECLCIGLFFFVKGLYTIIAESVVGGEQEGEEEQNERLTNLETASKDLSDKLTELKTYLEETIEVDIDTLEEGLKDITEKVNNITDLI